MSKLIQIYFQHEKETINPDELGEFLIKFNEVYRVASVVVRDISPEQFITDKEKYVADVRSKLCDLESFESIPGFECAKIDFNSPLSIWAMGVITALALAVIVSGGDVELFGAKFKVNSLGSGIEAINKAFNIQAQTNNDSSANDRVKRIFLAIREGKKSKLGNNKKKNT